MHVSNCGLRPPPIVVGGKCNHQLGLSTILTKVVGCNWPGKPYLQSGKRNLYERVPAHFTEVQVIEIVDPSKGQFIEIVDPSKKRDRPFNRIDHIWDYFQGRYPETRTINLLDTEEESAALAAEEDKVAATEGDAGTLDSEEVELEKEAEDDVKNEVEEREILVRFEFEGVLAMDVIIEAAADNLECTGYDRDTLELSEDFSFHVVDSSRLFKVRVNLQFELIKDRGLTCDIIGDDYQVIIINNVGLDANEGFDAFYGKIESEATKSALALCSNIEPGIGPCNLNVTHAEDNEGNKIGRAGVDTSFVAGRPNIVSPYTKSIEFEVTGGTSTAKHTAMFFVEGLYSKGQGNSFALPTYEPIMILRDPPGK